MKVTIGILLLLLVVTASTVEAQDTTESPTSVINLYGSAENLKNVLSSLELKYPELKIAQTWKVFSDKELGKYALTRDRLCPQCVNVDPIPVVVPFVPCKKPGANSSTTADSSVTMFGYQVGGTPSAIAQLLTIAEQNNAPKVGDRFIIQITKASSLSALKIHNLPGSDRIEVDPLPIPIGGPGCS